MPEPRYFKQEPKPRSQKSLQPCLLPITYIQYIFLTVFLSYRFSTLFETQTKKSPKIYIDQRAFANKKKYELHKLDIPSSGGTTPSSRSRPSPLACSRPPPPPLCRPAPPPCTCSAADTHPAPPCRSTSCPAVREYRKNRIPERAVQILEIFGMFT